MTDSLVDRHVKIAGERFRLRNQEIVRALRGREPEPIKSHFVVVRGRRFPPKQAISAVTGLDRADFTTHQARRTLMRLGFTVGRRGRGTSTDASGRDDGGATESMSDLVGQWVAIKDGQVLYAAASPQELVGWLGRHGQRADSMFRVPEDEPAASGLAPL